MPRKYWLMKCEPEAYTIDDLKRDGRTSWEGVRNYQARNFMRDQMQVGDGVLFYASNADPSGVTGLAEVVRSGYPDPTAFLKGHEYFDEGSKRDAPTWYMVDIAFVERFPWIVPLETLKNARGGHAERQPPVGATGCQDRVRHRRAAGSEGQGARLARCLGRAQALRRATRDAVAAERARTRLVSDLDRDGGRRDDGAGWAVRDGHLGASGTPTCSRSGTLTL
jgi:predicted RNA-binding protein with PUA-like domain